ncbi:sigma-54-dependent Fis family transcriptional regulator [Holophaga foetida]|uniref:sigma-54-dependent Fis family transcriptional regulator n=1 Tax=Holophaga foetida TaxID=35839 RepID=UPI0005BD47C2|nr:sigma-54-dependent Fis family transcriptional regulator [Holophaga foetida]
MAQSLRRQHRLAQVWEHFIRTGEVFPKEALRAEIADSWHRCKEWGIDPFAEKPEQQVTGAKLTALLQEKAELIRIATPFMQKVHSFVAGSGSVVLLFSGRGILMKAVGDAETLRAAPHINFQPGARWTEKDEGSNGVGTALLLGRPIQVAGREHYCRKYHAWTCSGAPIRNESGQITGVLELMGPIDTSHIHTLGMVVAAVQAIENECRIYQRNCELTMLNAHITSILRAASNGIIVLDSKGIIQQINPAGERLLSMSNHQATGLDLCQHMKRMDPLRMLLHSGVELQDQELELTLWERPIVCVASGRPIFDEQGQQQGAVLSVHPIQSMRRLINRYSGSEATFRFENILGRGPALQKALELARHAASDDSHVLLSGESGTGKEMFAQAIHNFSDRATGPFIAINCGAIPRELLASELFGYQEGAFTGANKGGRPGKFELAAGGTLFLDEIGDMPLDQQVALLRVLQDRTVTRLGGERPFTVDVRIICASHKELRAEVQKGTFREDLFYRLNVRPIHLPALREHIEDIPLLLEAFLANQGQKPHPPVDPDIIPPLQAYPWPGNIREFQNTVERILQASREGPIRIEHLPEEILRPSPRQMAPKPGSAPASPPPLAKRSELRESLDREARVEIMKALEEHENNVSRAAKALGLARNTLYRKMARLGI